MPLNLNKVVKINQELIASEVDGEILMVSLEDGKYYNLNYTGSRIWKLLQQPCKVSELIHMLQEEYEVAEEVCRQDVLQLLAEMEREKLVRLSGA
jgi:hypothetical protein